MSGPVYTIGIAGGTGAGKVRKTLRLYAQECHFVGISIIVFCP
jgi:hypothetical protein